MEYKCFESRVLQNSFQGGIFQNFGAMMMRYVCLAVMSCALLVSCSENRQEACYEPESSVVPVPLQFTALEEKFAAIETRQDVVDLFNGEEVLRDVFFKRSGYPNDSAFIRELHRRFTNPGIDTLASEVKRVFGDGSVLRNSFSEAYAHLRHYYPETRLPRVVTVISGLENDLYLSDTLVIVGLDFFLGDGAHYRPNMYEYMLNRYRPESIVPSVMLLIGIQERFNKIKKEDNTALAEMVSYGKAYVFARHMIPCVPDSTLFGYTAAETAGAFANEAVIWQRFVEEKVLFETSHLVKQRYLGERPNVPEISTRCPGRIGTWVGMQITEAYLKETETGLTTLMTNSDAQEIFRRSRYKPVAR